MVLSCDDNDALIQVLGPFLESRLPQLGLDYETYGSYILPLVQGFEDSLNVNTGLSMEAIPSAVATQSVDDDEWNSVLSLLQASSESHSDDDEAWITLRKDIETAASKWSINRLNQIKFQKEIKLKEFSKQLEKERAIAMEVAAMELEQQQQQQQNSNRQDCAQDEATRALIERYGYDDDEDDNDNNNNSNTFGMEQRNTVKKDSSRSKTNDSDTTTPLLSNKEYAAKLEKERIQELRMKKTTTTKREEQQKTNETRKQKEQLKEERRKRAMKGERKR